MRHFQIWVISCWLWLLLYKSIFCDTVPHYCYIQYSHLHVLLIWLCPDWPTYYYLLKQNLPENHFYSFDLLYILFSKTLSQSTKWLRLGIVQSLTNQCVQFWAVYLNASYCNTLIGQLKHLSKNCVVDRKYAVFRVETFIGGLITASELQIS